MPLLEHKWLSPIYTWAADYSSLTATRNCYLHEGEAETETVHATTAVVYPPSEEYETAYAAFSDEFINSAFAAQYTIIRTIPPLSTLNVLDLPDDLETIESEAFAGANCEAVLVPDGCTTIGSKAFANCEDLFYVLIPESVTNIAEDAFEGSPQVIIDREQYMDD